MHDYQSVLLISMPFAGIDIPSIQLGTLESYLRQRQIQVDSKHLYVSAADQYGIAHYNFLIYPPNDSYTAQLFFIKHVFPQHYQSHQTEIKAYFDQKISKNNQEKTYNLSYEEYQRRTDSFYQHIIDQLNWKDFDIIGFSCNYGQFLPSLAFAQHIKSQDPTKHIVFGGSRTSGQLGKATLRCFDYIDTIVSGEGEEALYQLSLNPSSFDHIPNLIYRKDSIITINPNYHPISLSDTPLPQYNSFYQTLSQSSVETQQYHQYYGRLPVEISRGCWWNKCSFCNLNLQADQYKEKSYPKIIDEITQLSNRYRLLSIQLIGNTLPVKDIDGFLHQLSKLKKDYTFIAEARADQFQRNHYTDLKQAGVSILQTGIESLSRHYLQKMNKGATVIENLAALKYCQERSIENHYNLIIGYPNEDDTDFMQTQQLVKCIQSYIDPPRLCTLRLVYESPIYNHPDEYGIDKVTNTQIDQLLFPEKILQQQISFVYDYTSKQNKNLDRWNDLIDQWQKERTRRKHYMLQTKQDSDRYVFYFIDGQTFLKIYDKRNKEHIKIYILDSFERKLFLNCLSIQHLEQLKHRFNHHDPLQLTETLDCFVDRGIMYEEDKKYLSLPLQYRLLTGLYKKEHQPFKSWSDQIIISLNTD